MKKGITMKENTRLQTFPGDSFSKTIRTHPLPLLLKKRRGK